MERLNFTENSERPYTFVDVMLAPKGAYYIDYIDYPDKKWADVYPLVYIQLWQDPDGAIWNVPLGSDEIQETYGDSFARDFQEYIEGVINENRHIETCMTCCDFLNLCRRIEHTSKDAIIPVMENLCEYVIKGEVGTTPELRKYFKSGGWGDLRTMENDGTLEQGWESRYLYPDGTLKPREEISSNIGNED